MDNKTEALESDSLMLNDLALTYARAWIEIGFNRRAEQMGYTIVKPHKVTTVKNMKSTTGQSEVTKSGYKREIYLAELGRLFVEEPTKIMLNGSVKEIYLADVLEQGYQDLRIKNSIDHVIKSKKLHSKLSKARKVIERYLDGDDYRHRGYSLQELGLSSDDINACAAQVIEMKFSNIYKYYDTLFSFSDTGSRRADWTLASDEISDILFKISGGYPEPISSHSCNYIGGVDTSWIGNIRVIEQVSRRYLHFVSSSLGYTLASKILK